MSEVFECHHVDAGGRIGELTVPRSGVTVETPALMPVINPNLPTIDPKELQTDFGAEVLITNAYIIGQTDDLREAAVSEGLHSLFDFDGAIMTDSGSFQLAEYDEIDIDTREILEFQYAIGSDIGTPVDIPTPPDVSHDRASAELSETNRRLDLAATIDTGDMLVSAPVQGSTHLDLRERAGRAARSDSFGVFPIGGVVPLLNAYRYADVVDVVAAAKRGLSEAEPVHLFGAGHPMMFALAVALGCDLFDSAAYAIYARDDRYLTTEGTRHLDEIVEFPCSCTVCASTDPSSLRELPDSEREHVLARHNLAVTFGEIRRIKEAIREGTLLTLVDQRARAHPRLFDGYRRLFDHADRLEAVGSISNGPFFYVSSESARHPEVRRYHHRADRLNAPDRLLVSNDSESKVDEFDAVWRIIPPFGPVPPELRQTYPINAELPEIPDRSGMEAAADGVAALARAHPDSSITVAITDWPDSAIDRLHDTVTVRSLPVE